MAKSYRHSEKRAHIPSKEEAGYEDANPQVQTGKKKLQIPVNPIIERGQDPELFWMHKYKNDREVSELLDEIAASNDVHEMHSLTLQLKEALQDSDDGQVQMIYIDPPYGIKYGSNWQKKLNDRNVTDGKDENLSGEPKVK